MRLGLLQFAPPLVGVLPFVSPDSRSDYRCEIKQEIKCRPRETDLREQRKIRPRGKVDTHKIGPQVILAAAYHQSPHRRSHPRPLISGRRGGAGRQYARSANCAV
jgi:hypothetical protein